MRDGYQRKINYLRISVTDRCDLRCVYCMPPFGPTSVPASHVLSDDEIVGVARAAVGLGFRKFRLTGGEPLLRAGLPALVRELAAVEGVLDLSLSTNGTHLAAQAADLAAAGLQRVNVSLDAVDPERYEAITRAGNVQDVLDGLRAAVSAGLHPIKINCVVEHSSQEPDARAVAAFARKEGFEIRYIRRMILPAGRFWPVEGGKGGDCPRCDRLRLTCEGIIKPCLFSDLGFSVRELGPETALRRAIDAKPESGDVCLKSEFYAVGG